MVQFLFISIASSEQRLFHCEVLTIDMFLANVRYGSQAAIIGSTPAHTGITPVTKICVTKLS